MNNSILDKITSFFKNNHSLMRHLEANACWEYVIHEKTLNDKIKFHFYLLKKDKDEIFLTTEKPRIDPDLILYFTEKAILQLIEGSPTANEYFIRYRNIMNNPEPDIQLDSKINKPRLKLLKLGYRNWQKEFKF